MNRFLIALATIPFATGCVPVEGAGTVDPETNGREVLFFEGFDDGSLDRRKWNVIGMDFWVNNEQQAYVDSPETIRFATEFEGAEGGVLILKPVFRPGVDTNADRKADFISGRINTRDNFDFTYGRAEARIRMPLNRGAWPAFWLLGNGQWPYTGEIDIMEYVGEPDWTAVAIHGPGYSGETPFVARRSFPDGEDASGWHVYGVEWTRDAIAFDVDGDVFYTVTRDEIEEKGEWRFDTPKFVILNFAMGGVYPWKVNKLEQPYYGIPQDTVDAVKAGEVQMEVDWVRVLGPAE
ncbi:glycoside hydrolase family 16 protein [Qipengyuania sp. XHP0207]|uniref:glycoside hydrolase family 16 protein n=1 Tax=Qipengyuania sp. XHP0207 TaxID=3038078 RepID=UPI00241CC99C|nr:glycoside hydrolase family 16 protein [Qipengyuania sp. XHP0207]MDG5746758.1 glycoside hydrolase family 16 protein [Qipengyuania sp. XHP0207]